MLAQQQWRVLVVLVCGGVLSLVECLAMRCGCTELADRSVILGKALAGCHLAGLRWLRVLVQARRRPSARSCCAPLLQGHMAGYQVVWASAVLTHICIFTRRESIRWCSKAVTEVVELARGHREHLSPDLHHLPLFPPVFVGLFSNSWDLHLRALAKTLGRIRKHCPGSLTGFGLSNASPRAAGRRRTPDSRMGG